MLLSEGQMSDHKGVRLRLPRLPTAKELLADRGYNSNRLRAELEKHGITLCIPPTKNREVRLPYDKVLYRQRHRIENVYRPRLML